MLLAWKSWGVTIMPCCLSSIQRSEGRKRVKVRDPKECKATGTEKPNRKRGPGVISEQIPELLAWVKGEDAISTF